MVKQLELAIRAEMDEIVGVFGVTALQYTALSVLARHPGMSSAELARRSFVSAQAGSEMIGLLERKGLISRTPHEANRRILQISLTRAGQRLLAECDEHIDDLEDRMLAPLSTSKVQSLRQALAACTRSLRPAVQRPTRPTDAPALRSRSSTATPIGSKTTGRAKGSTGHATSSTASANGSKPASDNRRAKAPQPVSAARQ